MRRRLLLLIVLLALPEAARAGSCIDPHWSYRALADGDHGVVAQQTLGANNPKLHFTTSCINLHAAIHISLGTTTGCVGQGDSVVATTADGETESCRITKVTPRTPASGSH